MARDYLSELLVTANRIMELDELKNRLTDKKLWKQAKKQFNDFEEQFNKISDQYIDALLSNEETRKEALSDVEGQLSEIRQKADASWHPAIEYVEDKFLSRLRKEYAKSPILRRAIKLFPYVAFAVAVVAYFGIRLFSATPITADIESREGLIERAAAAEKVLRYDDYMSTRVRRGGWLKGIFFWPIEPTEQEVDGAVEFVSLVIESQGYVGRCGAVTGYGNQLTDGQIKMIEEVADYIQSEEALFEDPPVTAVLSGLERASAC